MAVLRRRLGGQHRVEVAERLVARGRRGLVAADRAPAEGDLRERRAGPQRGDGGPQDGPGAAGGRRPRGPAPRVTVVRIAARGWRAATARIAARASARSTAKPSAAPAAPSRRQVRLFLDDAAAERQRGVDTPSPSSRPRSARSKGWTVSSWSAPSRHSTVRPSLRVPAPGEAQEVAE